MHVYILTVHIQVVKGLSTKDARSIFEIQFITMLSLSFPLFSMFLSVSEHCMNYRGYRLRSPDLETFLGSVFAFIGHNDLGDLIYFVY